MKLWIIILIFLISICVVWFLGFSAGFQSGIIEGSKPQFEQCGFYYDYMTGNYVKDIRNIKINWTLFENETA